MSGVTRAVSMFGGVAGRACRRWDCRTFWDSNLKAFINEIEDAARAAGSRNALDSFMVVQSGLSFAWAGDSNMYAVLESKLKEGVRELQREGWCSDGRFRQLVNQWVTRRFIARCKAKGSWCFGTGRAGRSSDG
ncbi:hypothetical protein L210DRAFT_3513124 [Boletus edulis BED1]|uniref:Uncharacterized protein n=1 Tax=Boletus edulis BED1 TaxID=1328754 RepID=A0AAD4G5F4_BOLED|nr:hypothetical protein L210DRAFT_3513124 [Boletus edulis BED1]